VKKIGLLALCAAFCFQLSAQRPRRDDSKVQPCTGCDAIIIRPPGSGQNLLQIERPNFLPGTKITWRESETPRIIWTVTFLNEKVCGKKKISATSKEPFCQIQNVRPGEYFYTIRLGTSKQTTKSSIMVTPAKTE
jgi:hypothetical protein